MAITKWDLAGKAGSRVYDSSTTVGSGVGTYGSPWLVGFVEDAVNYCEQFTGQTVGTTDVGSKFQAPVVNVAAANALAMFEGKAIDFSAGRLSISGKLAGRQAQIAICLSQAHSQLNMIGRRIEYDTSEP